MKGKLTFSSLLVLALFLTLALPIMATTWYVDGVKGKDSNPCKAPLTAACKTIGHAIALASSADSIMVAAATYSENLTISKSLTISGSSAATTIIDGWRSKRGHYPHQHVCHPLKDDHPQWPGRRWRGCLQLWKT